MQSKKQIFGHALLMAIACGGALLLIFVLPLFGISKNFSAGIAFAVMIGLHLLMMRSHSGHNHNRLKGGDK